MADHCIICNFSVNTANYIITYNEKHLKSVKLVLSTLKTLLSIRFTVYFYAQGKQTYLERNANLKKGQNNGFT